MFPFGKPHVWASRIERENEAAPSIVLCLGFLASEYGRLEKLPPNRSLKEEEGGGKPKSFGALGDRSKSFSSSRCVLPQNCLRGRVSISSRRHGQLEVA
ncbi:hypothetical protein VTK73DRAFT_2652 [Phialemonium thermophilum]|uniref:Uncharacterized protein n=1 Tax=Phialemonium thermophilum TaxID=223376 RepID=A0ABR3X3A1_9PEZI